ncbi:MAG: potassium transporter TrkG, partial [Bacteroidales bacterium]
MIIDLILWLFYNYLLVSLNFNDLTARSDLLGIHPKIWLIVAFSMSSIRETSDIRFNLRYKHTNPAAIFALSFSILILIGSMLLMLPRATHNGITFTNALFTSTSAVCVTGLIVVDTGTYFTLFGQFIILILIQLGGIGIMTFTSFFAYFFMGSSSYRNLIMLGNLTNENKIAEVIGSLKKILVFTFLVEAICFLLIYLNMKESSAIKPSDALFFSAFHSISAFCNAGFSTVSNSFYNIDFRYNYFLHLIIACTFIIGGIGFPVIINIYTWIKHLLLNKVLQIINIKGIQQQIHTISLNSKLVLYTTFILLIVSTVVF